MSHIAHTGCICCYRPPVEGGAMWHIFQENKTLDRIYRVFLHLIPAYIIDVIAQGLNSSDLLNSMLRFLLSCTGCPTVYYKSQQISQHNVQQSNWILPQILGHKPFLVRLVGKMHHGLDLLEYFCTRDSVRKVLGKKERNWTNVNLLCEHPASPIHCFHLIDQLNRMLLGK